MVRKIAFISIRQAFNILKYCVCDQFYLVPCYCFTFFQTMDRCRPCPGRNDCRAS